MSAFCHADGPFSSAMSPLFQNAIVSTDIGNICSVSNSYLRFDRPRSFLAALSFGSCGFAFPAAMGAKVAAPDRPCVAYVGDGAWGMSMAEVMTCVRENIPVIAVVFNNEQWGAEKKNQVREHWAKNCWSSELFWHLCVILLSITTARTLGRFRDAFGGSSG
jgi:thiamine pyrophosphate-dependent acetolactate synthase large subunit-like protein